MSRGVARVSQQALKKRFHHFREGKTEILIAPHFLERLQQAGIERVGEVIERAEIDPCRGGRRGLRVFCPDGVASHRCVVRPYAHGGLLRRLLGDRFLLGSRPFREMRITEEIRSRGIPTVQVLASIIHRLWGPFYRGELITREIHQATDLASLSIAFGDHSKTDLSLRWSTARQAGRAVRLMHDQGIYHGDLNLKNLLVQREGHGDPIVYVIDFDRSKVLKSLSTRHRIKNLLRLNRSAEKWKTRGACITYTDKARFFRAYAGGDPKIVRAMKDRLKRVRVRALWHRVGWRTDRLLNPPD